MAQYYGPTYYSSGGSSVTQQFLSYTQKVAGTYTWTVPTGVTSIEVEIIGGGAAASQPTGSNTIGQGGSGGGVSVATKTVIPGETLTCVVGAGGYNYNQAGGSSSVAAGTSGWTLTSTGGQSAPSSVNVGFPGVGDSTADYIGSLGWATAAGTANTNGYGGGPGGGAGVGNNSTDVQPRSPGVGGGCDASGSGYGGAAGFIRIRYIK